MLETLFTSTTFEGLSLACATCMGDAGSLINKAAGYAIAFMLLMLCVVLGSLIKFMSYLSKKDKLGAQPQPVPVRVSDDSNQI